MAQLSTGLLRRAITICAEHHSTKLTINYVKEDGFVPDATTLVIHECVPSVINKLKDDGFMLGMNEHGMYVDHL